MNVIMNVADVKGFHVSLVFRSPKRCSSGLAITVSHPSFGAHSGTHVDAPAYFIQGRSHVNSLDLNTLAGDVQVVDPAGAGKL